MLINFLRNIFYKGILFLFLHFNSLNVELWKNIKQEGHYFSDEDFIFNLKWHIWKLYMQGYLDTYIIENKQGEYFIYSIDVEIELERIKRSFKRVNIETKN